MGEEDEDVGESTCRQTGSTGRTERCQGGGRSRVLVPVLESGRGGSPAAHRDSTGWSGSDSAGSRAAEAGEEGRRRTERGWRAGRIWPASGSR